MKNKILLYIAASIGALIVFNITFTFAVVNPTNVNWLMAVRDDWGTHYLAWFFYRNEPWTFPLGSISRYYYSIGTNVGFTDSIPLMAIFFKLFSPILPDHFQYFGFWFLSCDLLLAVYTVKLLQLFRVRPVNIILAVLFVVSNPMLAFRGMHPALCSHWLLIGSLYNYFRDPGTDGTRKILLHQLVLLFLSAAINPYISFMVLGMTVTTAIKLYRYDKAASRKTFFRYLASCLGGMLLIWWLIGLIDFRKKDELGVGGAYGLYSMNLNSLYNSFDNSAFLPGLKTVGWYQYEGFMYLGIGALLLLLMALIHALYTFIKEKKKVAWKKLRTNGTYLTPLLILMVFFTLFAITQNISIGDKVLLRIPVPRFLTNLGDVFRASGRFFWLPYYLIMLFTLIAIGRFRIWWPLSTTLLAGALVLQSYDTWTLLTERRYDAGAYTPPLNKGWNTLMEQFDAVVFYPPFASHQLVKMDYQDFCYLAAEHRKPINIGYVARGDGNAAKVYGDSLSTMVEDGHLSPNSLYITTPAHLRHFALALQSDSAELHFVDGYYYLYVKGLKNNRLDSQSLVLDNANRQKLDSALKQIHQKNEFYATPDIPSSDKKPIHYYIERINKGRNYISLDGWGYLDSTNNNKGDSIYFTLRSAGGSYITPATITARPDLTDHYHRGYLGDAGFNVLAFYDSIPPGEYQLGIVIKDHQGHIFHQPDVNMITVDKR